MWLSQKTTAPSGGHQLGKVTGHSGSAVLVQSDTDYQSLRLAAPYGITCVPPTDAVAVVLSAGTGDGRNDVCIGTRVDTVQIKPGELLLRSAGGATIYLKNSGEVEINGRIF